MKKMYFIPLMVVFCYVFSSCNKEKDENNSTTGNIIFSFKSVLDTPKKASGQNLKQDSSSTEVPQIVIVSIIDNFGNVVKNMEEVPLYNMNGNYISKPLALKQGNYKLSDFLVIDKDGNVLYLTPKEGSPKAYLVSDPLPVEFNVSKDQVTKVNVEVLRNTGETPEEFGYSTFTFNVVDVFNFYVSVFTYSDSIQNFQLTSSGIEIFKDSSKIFENSLSPITNSIPLRKEVGNYKVVIKKNGYQDYSTNLTLSDLQGYTASNPLIVILSKTEFDFTNGLVAYYPFNGNANDESGNNHNGTVYGATLTADRLNTVNSAYEFDGVNDYINTFSTFDYANRTVSLWVNAYEIHDSGYERGIALVQDSYENSFGSVIVFFGDNNLSMNAGGTIPANQYYSSNIAENRWYHLVLVRDGVQTLYYINGSLVSTGVSGTVGSTSNPNPLLIFGSGRTTTVNFFSGKIDDIAIYNRALSASEVSALYSMK